MFDVVVIGAGPGGAQAALAFSERGRSVALLDSRHDIGNKLCTGIVSTECAEEYSVPQDLRKFSANGATVHTPSGRSIVIRRNESQAIAIDREKFVRGVATAAENSGTQLMLGFRATGIVINKFGVRVTASSNGRTEVIEARSVVLATGFQAPLADQIGLDTPNTIGLAAQVEIETDDVATVQVYARRYLPQTSFGWISPTGPGTAHIGLLGREHPVSALQGFTDGLEQDGFKYKVLSRPRYWGVPLRASRRSYGYRCLAVGDAAGQIKPTTGGGIYYAMKAGDMAAQTLDDALARDDFSTGRLKKYEEHWKSLLGKELRLGYMARLFYERLTDAELDRILLAADDSGILDGDVSFDHHSVLITKALKSSLFMSVLSAVPGVAARLALSR
ncbi:MAG: NAD(P)/FAD-dependent oxidoreductase [Chloroflexi bacterium]|nr:NAD(P)/FAD-dependent oxidoreductase [Chloroflexota bacterium]